MVDDKKRYETLIQKVKTNIIDWYPFKEEATILEISDKQDELELSKISNQITVINKQEELKEIKEKFDYIVIINKLKDVEGKFCDINRNLKKDGKILLIEENKLAIKNFCQTDPNKSNYNKKEIEEILNKYKLYTKFYYVLHDYKKANVIFTDKHLPDEETIQRNITFYNENSLILNNENTIYKKIIEQDIELFKIFSNSFFIECSNNKFADNEIELVSYSNIRKEEYTIKTIIKGNAVYKTYASEEAKKHIDQIKRNIDIMKENNINTLDSYKDDIIISQYQKDRKTLDKILTDKISNGEIDYTKEIIEKFYNEIKNKLVETDSNNNVFDKYNLEYIEENINNLNFVKYGLWDLIFQNTFYIDDEFMFYDQEWIEENVPVEYIMYRAIKYCKTLQNLLTKEMLYDIIGINEKNVELFDKLDEILQKNTRSENNWKIHSETNDVIQMINRIKEEKEKMYQESLKLLNEKDARIKFLEDNMDTTCKLLQEKEQQISAMENSTSWKITKPLRKLGKTKKGE